MKELILLKLGGSLITDKTRAFSVKKAIIKQCTLEVKNALRENPRVSIIISTGAGSGGHFIASREKDRHDMMGFSQIHHAVVQLNMIVVKEFLSIGIPACSFHPSSMMVTQSGTIGHFFISALMYLLGKGIVPVLHSDMVGDTKYGSFIVSGEKLFHFLVQKLPRSTTVKRIIQAGKEKGVLDKRGNVIPLIAPSNFDRFKKIFYQPSYTDVSGGMLHKVKESLILAEKGIQSIIIKGDAKDHRIAKAILGKPVEGTIIEVSEG